MAELEKIKEGIKRCDTGLMIDGGDMTDHGWTTIAAANKKLAYRPQVGIGVIILNKQGQILLAPRPKTKAVGAGMWQLPGGHLEMYEGFANCAEREVTEECGNEIKIETPQFFTVTNNPWPNAKKHYITIFLTAWHINGEAQSVGGHGPWSWHSYKDLPKPMFEASGVFTPQNIRLLDQMLTFL